MCTAPVVKTTTPVKFTKDDELIWRCYLEQAFGQLRHDMKWAIQQADAALIAMQSRR